MQSPLGVVLVCRWSAEAGHHGVADELLDRPAGTIDLGRHRVVEAVEESARALGIRSAGERGRADQVGEENRCQLALFLRRRRIHRRGTGVTEPSIVGVLLPALCTDRHMASVRRVVASGTRP